MNQLIKDFQNKGWKFKEINVDGDYVFKMIPFGSGGVYELEAIFTEEFNYLTINEYSLFVRDANKYETIFNGKIRNIDDLDILKELLII